MRKTGVILTGFMGVGKSTIGPALAERLGLSFEDTDARMESMGVDIPALVKASLTAFRAVEAMVLRESLGNGEVVISTGGGIVTTELGRSALFAARLPVVWMNAPFAVLAERVAKDPGRERPLFNDVDGARELYEARLPLYAATANHIVDASQPAEAVVTSIVSVLRPDPTTGSVGPWA